MNRQPCVPGAVARRPTSPHRHAELVSASISSAAACPAAPLLHAIRAPRANRRHGLWILKQVQDDEGGACIPGAVARRLPSPRRHAELVSASISYAAACPAAPLLHAIRVPRANRRHGLWILKRVQDDGFGIVSPGISCPRKFLAFNCEELAGRISPSFSARLHGF
jgi:hypothetical protein